MNEEVTMPKSELQELSLLLENRTFVDYFNTFLSLPVFGQHVFYKYIISEFEFEPRIKNKRHMFLDRRDILCWLTNHRLPSFKRSPLYSEYKLCMQLRSVDAKLPGLKDSDDVNGEDRKTFTRNLMGTITGMLLFRESMRGTCGENVYRCWKDIETWRQIEDPIRRMYWKNAIRTKYISQASTLQVPGRIKLLVYRGVLNFDLIPDAVVQQTIIDSLCKKGTIQATESDDAMMQLQRILLTAMTSYWVPRHLLHVIKSVSEETLRALTRPAPGDTEYLSKERKLHRQFMFPTINDCITVKAPATSKSAGKLPRSSLKDYDVDKDYVVIDHKDLFQLWTGPAKDIAVERSASAPPTYTLSDRDERPVEVSKSRLKSKSANFSKTRATRSLVPILLTSYLGGKKRTLLGRFPNTTNRIIWSLASDLLACFPFRSFLERKELISDIHYLSFWNDVRTYLDTDENVLDSFGKPLRRILAQRLMQNYLASNGESCEIFSETLKTALFNAISKSNDVALLSMAQDIVQESLWESLKMYIEDDRRTFLHEVIVSRFDRDNNLRRKQEKIRGSICTKIDSDSAKTGSSQGVSLTTSPSFTRATTSDQTSLSEEQMWKAMEHTVLCCEYGTSMMLPQKVPTTQELVDILYSDYGSLHMKRAKSVKNEALNKLMFRPKINIETIKVSREVIDDEVDFELIRLSKETEKEVEYDIIQNRLVIRRHGMVIEKPKRPKSFAEVFTTDHFEFFKHFLMMHNAGHPVFFWEAVQELKSIRNARSKRLRVTQIMRKFFGKFARYGAVLDCNEDVIRQIPHMSTVTASVLVCAQNAVYRSMERKWYGSYMETFPKENEMSDAAPSNVIHVDLHMDNLSPEMVDIADRAKRRRRYYGSYKVIRQFRNLIKGLCGFCRAINSKPECQLLEIFLKCELEREQASMPKEHFHRHNMMLEQAVEGNIGLSFMATNIQTRVVIRNRLVIMNRLPQDLRYWVEVRKYQDLVDTITFNGKVDAYDNEILVDKARSLVQCFLHSEILPNVQINIPNDMALNIINTLTTSGPTRGLFHDSIILIFPHLFYYWKKFTDEWMNGDIPDDYIETIERAIRDQVTDTPHGTKRVPDHNNMKHSDLKFEPLSMFDNTLLRINFTIADGASFLYPEPPYKDKLPVAADIRSKYSKFKMHPIAEKTSPRRGESRMRCGGDDACAKKKPKSAGMVKESLRNIHTFAEEIRPRSGESRMRHGSGRHSGRNERSGDDDANTQKKPNSAGKEKELERNNSATESRDSKVKPSKEKARKLSSLVETLNREREEKLRESRKLGNKMAFEEVVASALSKLSDSGSVFS